MFNKQTGKAEVDVEVVNFLVGLSCLGLHGWGNKS